MKKFLLVLVVFTLLGYLIVSTLYFEDNRQSKVCENFKVLIKDSVDKQFIKAKDIEKLLKRADLYPMGKSLADINTMEMEEAIRANKLVKSVNVYTIHNGNVVANIFQRNPVMRIISNKGENYYIDSERERMPISPIYTVYLPLVIGDVSEDFAKNGLYDFVSYISGKSFWDAWIEQVLVSKDNRVQLVPRAGNFKVTLGTLDNYKEKLEKLKLFIDKGLNTVGWNRYSEINLEYNDQVVCTLK